MVLKSLLSEFRMKSAEWPKLIPLIQGVLNHTPSTTLGNLAPIQVFTGQRPTSPIDTIIGFTEGNTFQTEENTVEFILKTFSDLRQNLDNIHAQVAEVKEKKRAKSRVRHFRNHSVKLIQRKVASEDMLENFRRERQILADLRHPHICSLLDGGTTQDGFPYFLMEYIEGETIARWCQTHHPTLIDLIRMFSKISGALAFAHRGGITHRDIKPGNLLVTHEGEPKLLEFRTVKNPCFA